MKPDIHALAGPYALDAVPDGERDAFEAHLARCVTCRAEVAELRAVAARLGAAAAGAPPAALRDRVLAGVERTRQDGPRLGRRPSHAPARRPRALLAAAAVAAAVLGVAGALRLNQLDARVERLQAVTDVLTASDAATVALRSPAGAAAEARLVRSSAHRAGVLVARRLPSLPDDRTYELWLAHDGRMAPAGRFRPGGSGAVEHVVDEDVTTADAVAISVEPAGGSPQPTGDLVLFAELRV